MERILFFVVRLECKTDETLVGTLALTECFGDVRCFFELQLKSLIADS